MNKKFYFALFFFLININTVYPAESIFEILAEKIKYEKKKNIIIAEGNAKVWDNKGKEIYSDKIIYDKKNNFIKTFNNSKFINNDITISAKNFIYDVNKKIIEAKDKIKVIDNNKNIYLLDKIKYFVEKKIGEGSGLISKNSDGSYLKSKHFKIDIQNKISNFLNNDYTTCKNIKKNNGDYCPSWTINSKETKHDQKKGEFIHKNAVLKISNIPVFYSPYLKHPDPKVKRKSGFLPPRFRSLSNVGNAFELPYFYAISEDKDFTFSPIFYSKEKPLILSNYRQKFKNSSLEIDNSYWSGFSTTNSYKTKGSRNHFFADFESQKKDLLFKNNKIIFKLQRVSQENYLKHNKINTKLVNQDIENLENKIELISYDETKKISISSKVFEKLNINSNEKYEYVLPNINFNKNFYKNNGDSFNLSAYFEGKQLKGNEKQIKSVNTLSYNNNPKIYKSIGLSQILKTSLQNINYNTSSDNKNGNNINNYLTIGLDNSIPLYKKKSNVTKTLVPRFFVKYTTGSEKYFGDQDKEIEYFDIFSMNRSNDMLKPEIGLNAGLGVDFEHNVLNKNQQTYLKNKFGIGQIFNNKNYQMPVKSSLNQKSSDLVGFYNFSLLGDINKIDSDKDIKNLEKFKQNNLNFEYKFNINDNLNSINKNIFNLSTIYKDYSASISFTDKKNIFDKEKYYSLQATSKFSKNLYLSFDNKKNLVTNNTEKISYGITYENDCLSYSLSFNKEFYKNESLDKNKSLVFSIVIKPFGDSLAPDLSSFVK